MKPMAGHIIAIFALSALVAIPLIAAADNATGIPYWPNNGLISCVGEYSVSFPNGSQFQPQTGGKPSCTSVCDLLQTFVNIIYFIMTVCLFIIAPLSFAIGGIMLMASGANPEMRSQGRSVLTGTVIGVGIILCSYLLVYTFVGVFHAVTNGGQSVFGNSIQCTAQYPS